MKRLLSTVAVVVLAGLVILGGLQVARWLTAAPVIGYIYQADGRPANGAAIRSGRYQVRSGRDGWFQIRNPKGALPITVEFEGTTLVVPTSTYVFKGQQGGPIAQTRGIDWGSVDSSGIDRRPDLPAHHEGVTVQVILPDTR